MGEPSGGGARDAESDKDLDWDRFRTVRVCSSVLQKSCSPMCLIVSPASVLPLGPAAGTDIGAGCFVAPSVSGDSGIGSLFVLFLRTDDSLSLAVAVLGLEGRKSPE